MIYFRNRFSDTRTNCNERVSGRALRRLSPAKLIDMENAHIGYRFLLIAVVLALNAFFAAAEVALVSVRQSRLKQLAEDGQAGAKAALSLLANTERLLSVVQVGVTLASLAMGWAGESTLFAVLSPVFQPLVTPATANLFHGITFALAFLVMTYAHVVIGEVVPKNLAIEKADRLAVLVAPILLLFYRVSSPFVVIIEKSAGAISKILGLKGAPLGGGHSAEELKLVISASRRHGQLNSFEEKAIQHMLDLRDYLVREIMVPRSEIVSVPVDATMDDVLKVMNERQFSRLPVYDDKPEHIIGIIHYKDMLSLWHARRSAAEKRRPVPEFDPRRVMRTPFVVPETKPSNQLIDDFRKQHSHMALVVDEFGTVVGLVTLEDVLEQIFGEIEDEHDAHVPPVAPQARVMELDGSVNIRDLETQYGIEVPVDAGYETLAGFLLYRLGAIPNAGAVVIHENFRFTVLEMERNRIAKVRVEKLEEDAGEGAERSGSDHQA